MESPDFAPDEGITVVGGGAAGHATIAAYLEAGGAGPVTLLTAEDRLPYHRPALTKEVLDGGGAAVDPPALDDELYADDRIAVHLGTTVRSIDSAAQQLWLDGATLRYARLVLATGSSRPHLGIPGAELDAVLSVRSLGDVRRVLAATDTGGHLVVLGGDLVGCELAAALRSRGVDVTMVLAEELPQLDRFGRDAAELIAGWLREAGVHVRGRVIVRSIEPNDGGVVVRAEDDVAIEAAHVVLATGSTPSVELAAQLGLDVVDGVQVDAKLHTRVPGVVAVGEIARRCTWSPVARCGSTAGTTPQRWVRSPGTTSPASATSGDRCRGDLRPSRATRSSTSAGTTATTRCACGAPTTA